MATTFEQVKEVIVNELGANETEVTEATSFKEDLDADSLDLFEMIMALEEQYEIEIPSEELENLTTVGEVVRYIDEKLA
ncbi:acyl carrier protein [Coprococcus sp. AF21-14LB]|uniref:acyl carrier protein n=1 Tax=Coprococcus sp. AF21-14LB TaxID=2292231 RepID=UPI000E4C3426|nr:acyl carrier protein [Coprococcus sp. AF21-14LB]RGS77484.1 acyl carrier protein [Coprococcus sp. AF21-14LB]